MNLKKQLLYDTVSYIIAIMTRCHDERRKNMPKQTFFNLPEEKKRNILRAARLEFSRVSFEEAAIANIIKTAQIPRGSFYQYFENKEDLFIFMMKNMGKRVAEKTDKCLKESGGDIVETFIELFYYFIEVLTRDENTSLFKNVFLNMNDKIKDSFTESFRQNHDKFLEHLISHIDESRLTLQGHKELIYVLKMMNNVLLHSIAHYFKECGQGQETIEMFLFQMNIIKKSIYKP
ncbi:MAG: TetR family transcriptional regulator [Clostridia bacterium]|nr:TetR family transcriptional regulator [Clostridia bacterium]